VVSDPISALWRPEWSTWLVVTVKELVKVLKIEECSTEAEDKLVDPDRFLARPLTSEPVRNSEPVNVLKSEAWAVVIELNPRIPVNNSTRPLDPEIARPSEPVNDLPMPLF
jgi:hypothetical protein